MKENKAKHKPDGYPFSGESLNSLIADFKAMTIEHRERMRLAIDGDKVKKLEVIHYSIVHLPMVLEIVTSLAERIAEYERYVRLVIPNKRGPKPKGNPEHWLLVIEAIKGGMAQKTGVPQSKISDAAAFRELADSISRSGGQSRYKTLRIEKTVRNALSRARKNIPK